MRIADMDAAMKERVALSITGSLRKFGYSDLKVETVRKAIDNIIDGQGQGADIIQMMTYSQLGEARLL